MEIQFREIIPSDNKALAKIIADAMREFGADPKTTILGDPALHTMYGNFQVKNAIYFVALENNRILGGAGIRQLDGTNEKICELQRMFLIPEARGKKIGKKLMQMCFDKAKEFGYKKIYLESLKTMNDAKGLYESSGFERIDEPCGDTGHCGCDVFMEKILNG